MEPFLLRFKSVTSFLATAKSREGERGQEGPHGGARCILSTALDHLLRAGGTRARRARRAHHGRWALNFRAARTRARRALTALGLVICAGVDDNWALLRNTALQHVVRQVWHRWALRLQHIVGHVRAYFTGGDGGLQHILRHVRHRGACRRRGAPVVRAGPGCTTLGASRQGRAHHSVSESFGTAENDVGENNSCQEGHCQFLGLHESHCVDLSLVLLPKKRSGPAGGGQPTTASRPTSAAGSHRAQARSDHTPSGADCTPSVYVHATRSLGTFPPQGSPNSQTPADPYRVS